MTVIWNANSMGSSAALRKRTVGTSSNFFSEDVADEEIGHLQVTCYVFTTSGG